MNAELTTAQIQQYREDGFIVQEDFLTSAEVERWREVLDESLGMRGNLLLPPGVDNTDDGNSGAEKKYDAADGEYYKNVFTQRVNLWMDNPEMKELILDPRIGRMCCELEGIDAIRVWHDQTLIKPPWGNATSWHLDNPYWSFHSPHAVSIWIALDDATLANGCLWFIPGSHKKQSFENVGIGRNYGSLFDVHPEWRAREAVSAEMKAGSCSFHNGITAHGAGVNNTPYHRRAMTCAFMPEGSTFNGQQNVLPKERFKQLEVGDPLNDENQNPLIYSRGMAIPGE